MKPYPRWKYALLIFVTVFGALYALPNLYGEQPSVQISERNGEALPASFGDQVAKALTEAGVTPADSRLEQLRWNVLLDDETAQLKAAEALKKSLGNSYTVALSFASRTPKWLLKIGARPMALGLDLRGGVHLLLEVDVAEASAKAVARYVTDLPTFLRKQDIRYTSRRQQGDAAVLEFADAEKLAAAQKAIAAEYSELELIAPANAVAPTLEARLSAQEARRLVDFAVTQNLTTLRNRVNQLGVAEPVVQRQGLDRIVVELPGVQDATRMKDLLGATATLEYRAVDTDSSAEEAARTGIVPPGFDLHYERGSRRPVLLDKDVVVTGDQLIDAVSTMDQESGTPAVSVTLDGNGAKRMLAFTEKNVGKPMGVLLSETQYDTSYDAAGNPVRTKREVRDVINVATVRGVFGKRFQTTGLSSKEALDIAVLLRSGALAAPVSFVEERTVGPSLGADNIRKGFAAAVLGLSLVAIFMVVYYRVFGLFAVAAVVTNLLIVIAVLSLINATLTMPGIAGIVLHMGIAVDANVLIYERIREELRAGNSPHAAIQAGYDRAFLTIADANVTVLIGTFVLFFLGAGPVKGFAITLAIGIISSQFTAIVGSRALAQLAFARKKMTDVPVW